MKKVNDERRKSYTLGFLSFMSGTLSLAELSIEELMYSFNVLRSVKLSGQIILLRFFVKFVPV